MKYLRYIILLVIVLLYILATISVEPFFENNNESYILILREPNEKMLTKFININLDKPQMAFDLSSDTPSLSSEKPSLSSEEKQNAFILQHPEIFKDVDKDMFKKIFKRESGACEAIAPSSINIPNTATTSLSSTLDGQPFIDSTELTSNGTSLKGSALNRLLQEKSAAYGLNGLNTARERSNLYVPWTCPTNCSASSYTFSSPPPLTSLPSELTNKITNAVDSATDSYGTSSTVAFSPDALKTTIKGKITDYIQSSDFQSTPTGYSCTSPYVPTYMKPSASTGGKSVYPIPDPTADTTQPFYKYYNAILIGRTSVGGVLKHRIIANEVGNDHVDALFDAQKQ